MIRLSTQNVAVRMMILMAAVGALDCTAIALSDHPLRWASWIPGLLPLLTPVAIWPLLSSKRNSSPSAK